MTICDHLDKDEALHLLSISYEDTFRELNSPDNNRRFTKKEKGTFNYIKKSLDYKADKNFSVDICRTTSPKSEMPLIFNFTGTPDELQKTPKQVVDFICAHEIKHASLAYNQVLGVVNIHSFVLLTTKMNMTVENIKNNHLNLSLFCNPLSHLTRLASAAYFRYEERICDDFALRTFPNVDLDLCNQFLGDHSSSFKDVDLAQEKLVESDEGNKKKKINFFRSAAEAVTRALGPYYELHPQNEMRNASLLNKQNKLKGS